MKKILPILFAVLLLSSCGKKVILNETRTFDRNTWMRFQPETFQVEANTTEDCFNIYATVEIDTSLFKENGLPLMIEIKSPQGDSRTLFNTVLLRDHQGNWMGNFNDYGVITVSQMIRQFYFFNALGTHTFNLSQRTNKYEIQGINGITLKIEKTKIEYPE